MLLPTGQGETEEFPVINTEAIMRKEEYHSIACPNTMLQE